MANIDGELLDLLIGHLVELNLHRDGGVVGTEHLGGQSLHERLQVLVQLGRRQLHGMTLSTAQKSLHATADNT